jgi:hypothetical protein
MLLFCDFSSTFLSQREHMGVSDFEQVSQLSTTVIFGKCQFPEMVRTTDSETTKSSGCVDSAEKPLVAKRSRKKL